MSEVSQGPGWWIASDGRWYPPELHPSYRPPEVLQQTQDPPEGLVQAPGQPSEPAGAADHSRAASPREDLQGKGFIRSLYDFSFSSFVTMRVIRVLYILITILFSVGAVAAFVALIARHTAESIATAIVGVPLVYLVYLTVSRIALEVLMVIFRIGQDVGALRASTPAAGGQDTPGETGYSM